MISFVDEWLLSLSQTDTGFVCIQSNVYKLLFNFYPMSFV